MDKDTRHTLNVFITCRSHSWVTCLTSNRFYFYPCKFTLTTDTTDIKTINCLLYKFLEVSIEICRNIQERNNCMDKQNFATKMSSLQYIYKNHIHKELFCFSCLKQWIQRTSFLMPKEFIIPEKIWPERTTQLFFFIIHNYVNCGT